MGITAALCILIGIMPSILYPWLPYPVEFIPYTTNHVISQLQLLFFALLAFTIIIKLGLHPKDKRSINLDTDWVYRKLIPSVFKRVYVLTNPRLNKLIDWLAAFKSIIVRNLVKYYGPGGYLSKLWPTGTMVLWVAILLLASLSLSFIA
jgi:multicomponent Na+:H+ antiporter subunit D